MLRGIALLVSSLSSAPMAQSETGEGSPAATCEGVSDDGRHTYYVEVFDGANAKPRRVILILDDAETPFDFQTFDDRTPKAPTDEKYRYVFREEDAVAGDLSVMLMDGGFTQHLTAQIQILGGDDPESLATLNCVR